MVHGGIRRLMPNAPTVEPPAGRGGIVVAVTFVNLILFYGVWYSYSVFLVTLLKEFGWSRTLASGVFSTFLAVHGMLAPLAGWLLARVGPRRTILGGAVVMALGLVLSAQTTAWYHLYLAFGGVAAVGVTLGGWIPSVVLVRGWFPDRVGTAIGIASSGIGVGIFLLVPVAQMLIDAFGWRWAFRLFAVAIAVWVLPATAILIRDPVGAGTPCVGGRSSGPLRTGRGMEAWTLATACRTWQFWSVAAVYFTGNFVTQMLLIHQVAYLVDHGIPALTAAALGGTAGLVSIAGKIGWGALSDRTGRPLAYGLAFVCVASSIGCLVLAGWYPTSYLPYAYAIILGIGYGAMAPLPPAIASDLFAGPGFSLIFGSIYTVGAFGLAAGTWTAGWIFDTTGSYAAALWLGLFMASLSPCFMWLVAPRRAPMYASDGPARNSAAR
jgi:MFS family permease